MQFVRKAVVFLAATFLSPILFGAITALAVVMIITPAHIKTWLADSGVYTKVDNAVLQSIDDSNQDNGSTGDLLSQPGAQAAAKQAFTPQLLERSANTFIDGLFGWLEGKTSTPSYRIDLSSAKQSFANGIGSYALNRYNSLPVCAKGQAPDTSDVLNITCRLAGFDISPAITQEVQSVATSKDFLPNPVITGSNLTVQSGGRSVPVAQKFADAPKVYRWLRLSPYILGGFSLLGVVVIIFASVDRRKGLRRVSWSFMTVAILLLIDAWAVSFSLRKIQLQLNQNDALASLASSTLTAVLHNIAHLYEHINVVAAISLFVLAVGVWIYLLIRHKRVIKPKNKPAKAPAYNPPSRPPAQSSAPSDQPQAPTGPPVPPAQPRPRPPKLIQ